MLLLLAALASAPTQQFEKHDAPVVLSIAGSDSGGGAGVQADLKTCQALGAFGTTAIVAVTVQNTQGVSDFLPIDPKMVRAQIDSVLSDIGAHAIKTGMLPTTEIIKAAADGMDAHKAHVRVIDPVFVAASGDVLVSPEAVEAIRTILVPTATVLTPNMPEAGRLLGRAAPETVAEMKEAAKELIGMGAQSVLLKGGRLADSEAEGAMVDIYADAAHPEGKVRLVELRYSRLDTPNTHGAGCTVAAAVAAELAKQVHAGHLIDTLGAVKKAREYLGAVFAASADLKIGKGARGPLNHAQAPWAKIQPKSSTEEPTADSAGAATGSDGERVSKSLWADADVSRLAKASLSSGFLTALADGTLPKANFAGYVAQDKFFLEAFARAYTLALNRLPAEDQEGIMGFAALVRGVVDELKLHASYAAKWGVDMKTVNPAPACQSYVDFLMDVVTDGARDVAACAAAMVPCMRLYAFLGQALRAANAPAGPYQEWVDTYADTGFEELAASLEAMLDRYAAGATTKKVAELRELYVKAMELELDFFEAWGPDRQVEQALKAGDAAPDREGKESKDAKDEL